jgi:large-conductance mechanosensitive channel
MLRFLLFLIVAVIVFNLIRLFLTYQRLRRRRPNAAESRTPPFNNIQEADYEDITDDDKPEG